MQIHTLLTLASLGAVAAAIETCGNRDDLVATDTFLAARAAVGKRQDTTTKAVDVYFHVASTPANSNRITDEIVTAQVSPDARLPAPRRGARAPHG